MTVDTATLIRLRVRIATKVARPPMFHEVWTPSVLGRRQRRIMRWMGPHAAVITGDYIQRRQTPTDGRKWSRYT